MWIAPGSHRRGSPADESDRGADEGPTHEVTLSRGFFLGREEVTQRQWVAVMGTNPSVFRQPVADEDPLERPVDSVSWDDAMQFIDRLNASGIDTSGLGRFRLPTEAEWALAAQSNDDRTYPWGNRFENNRANIWLDSESSRLCAVGLFIEGRGPYGHDDLAGNVWEWTSSLCWQYPYRPSDGRENLASNEPRAMRGGSWRSKPISVRCNARQGEPPTDRFEVVGFRLARDT